MDIMDTDEYWASKLTMEMAKDIVNNLQNRGCICICHRLDNHSCTKCRCWEIYEEGSDI